MFRMTIRTSLWFGATLLVAVGAIAIGDGRYGDVDGAVAKACTGAVSTRQLDNVLFNVRALSEGGADPICAPPDEDDEFDGVMLSHLPSFRAEAASARR